MQGTAAHQEKSAVIADNVPGIMSANRNGYETWQQCYCSVDYIGERLDYTDYENVQTVLNVRLDLGQRDEYCCDSS